MLKAFFYLHLSGLLCIAAGLYLLLVDPTAAESLDGMTWIAVLLGLGGLMISPYPVVKAIQWMQNQPRS